MEACTHYRITHAAEFFEMTAAQYIELEQDWQGRQMYMPTDEDFEE